MVAHMCTCLQWVQWELTGVVFNSHEWRWYAIPSIYGPTPNYPLQLRDRGGIEATLLLGC